MPIKYGDIAKAPKGTSFDMPAVWLRRNGSPLAGQNFVPPI